MHVKICKLSASQNEFLDDIERRAGVAPVKEWKGVREYEIVDLPRLAAMALGEIEDLEFERCAYDAFSEAQADFAMAARFRSIEALLSKLQEACVVLDRDDAHVEIVEDPDRGLRYEFYFEGAEHPSHSLSVEASPMQRVRAHFEEFRR